MRDQQEQQMAIKDLGVITRKSCNLEIILKKNSIIESCNELNNNKNVHYERWKSYDDNV